MHKGCETELNFLVIQRKINRSRYRFPQPKPLRKKLKDVLEEWVDEKYYLTEKQVDAIRSSKFQSRKFSILKSEDDSRTLRARDWKGPLCVEEEDHE